MKDLIGKESNELTIISVSKRKGKANQPYVWCSCSCGKETEVRLSNFTAGSIKSCGCKKTRSVKKTGSSFSISTSPAEKTRLSSEQKAKGVTRESIEDIQDRIRLKREFDELSYAM